MTLQLNKEQTVVKEDSRQDAWEVKIFSLLYIIDWRKYAQCLRCMLCCVLCFASWLRTKVTQQPAQGVTTCVLCTPTWMKCCHESRRWWLQPGDWVSDGEKKKLEAGTHGWRVKRKLDSVKRALITICSSVGCTHEVRQSSHYNKCFQSHGYVEYFSVKQTELKGEELHFE